MRRSKERFFCLGVVALYISSALLAGCVSEALAKIYPTPAGIVLHQGHGIPESKDFKVWVNGSEMFTGQAGDRRWSYSFCAFDFERSVAVRVRFDRAIKWVDIMPSILKIEHTAIDDNTFEFTLGEPKKITIIINNDRNNTLHILTNLPEKNRPNPEDKNILFYKAGKTYDIGVLDIKSNQTLYIESGAKLKGMIRIRDADNVRIMGRGMIDGTDNKSRGGRFSNEPWRLIYMENANNVKIQGITLYNSLKWTIHSYDCKNIEIENINLVNWDYGSDGFDISGCQNVKVKNSFFRTNDDCIVIKSLSLADKMYYPNRRIQNPDVKDILVEGCTLWNMAYGNAFDIGFELRCDRVGDIIFRDCDVLMQEGRGAIFSIHNSDNAMVENVLFDDIRIENANQTYSHKLFDVAILFSVWSYDKFTDSEMINKHRYNDAWDNLLPVLPGKEEFHASHRGHVRDIHFRNIQVLDGKLPYSVINGFDEDHIVANVTFENISVQGRKLTNAEELKLFSKYAKNIQFK
jgi:polygalacturonase